MNKSDWSALPAQVKKQIPWNMVLDNPQVAMDKASELAFKTINRDYVDLCYYLYRANPDLELEHELMLIAAARVGHLAFTRDLLENYEMSKPAIKRALRMALKHGQINVFAVFASYIEGGILDFIEYQEGAEPTQVPKRSLVGQIKDKQEFVDTYVMSPWALERILSVPALRKIFVEQSPNTDFGDLKRREELYYTCVRDDLSTALQYYIMSGKFKKFAGDSEAKLYAERQGYTVLSSVLKTNVKD